jgi:hypothetical protein
MAANKPKLVDLVDTRNGLLDEMLAAECINNSQIHSIEKGETAEIKNERLYLIVFWGGLTTYNAFIRCLLLTKQHQVVFLLEPSQVGDVCPLSDEQLSRLKRNQPALIRLLNVKYDLTARLLAADCITWRQKEYIEITESERNTRLLDIVRRGSQLPEVY